MTKEEAKIYLESVFPVLNAKMQEAIKALWTEQESIEVEATELQKAYNKGFEDCRRAVLEIFGYVMDYWKEHAIDVEPHEIKDALIEQYEFTAKQLSELTPVTPQELITDRVEYGTDGNTYRLTISNGKELKQEPQYCDRNICVSNEYNGIGCDGCEVTKSQEPRVGHWIMTSDYLTTAYGSIDYVKCSCCGEDSLEEGDYCPNCGCRMVEPQERSKE